MRNENSFLEKLAQELFTTWGVNVANLSIVLPNQRAKIFLIDALKKHAKKNIFAPKIISIEEFVQQLAKINAVDNIELLFEFYKVYCDLTKSTNIQSFDKFANWGKILIQDFNEIDRYLLDTKKVFNYLTDVEVLNRWNLKADETTDMIRNNIDFWNKLPIYYQSFSQHLLNKKIGYQGLIYRQAVLNLENEIKSMANQSFVFAGFNALNQAEEIIFQRLLATNKAQVFWDIDEVFLSDTYHDAGLFVRRFHKKWPFYKENNFEWIVNEFSSQKNIKVIGTPKSIGQAKIAGKLIEDIQSQNSDLTNVAIILGQEALLLPTLNALPAEVNALNITMGYSAQNNPAQILINKIFKLHLNAMSKQNYEFYYKDLLAVISHPYIESRIDSVLVSKVIKEQNQTFIIPQAVVELFKTNVEFVNLLLAPWENSVPTVLDTISKILLYIKEGFNDEDKNDLLAKSFVYAIYQVLNKIATYQQKHNLIHSTQMLYAIYKQSIELAEVSFEGEPLKGLQVMGVLESRVLDFETVIVTSLNEGVFPAGKSSNSFIPVDVKVELGLPTFKEKDAIYSYHFYHILLRAKNIYLLYNSEPADGIDKGEKSRFITQVIVEKQPNHNIQELNYNAVIPEKAQEDLVVTKSEHLQNRLKQIATDKGFSPSSIGSYLRSPLGFYKQRVLRINDVDEVEENIAANTLGTIIHNVLEELYKPLINKFISESEIDEMLSIYKQHVDKQFNDVYKKGEIKKGKNLIAYKVAEKYITNFLELEKQAIKKGDAIKIISLEKAHEVVITHKLLPYPVKISGKVDRIEYRNGKYRIIDYKSGAVAVADVRVKNWDVLTADDKKSKAIQLLCYALMIAEEYKNEELEVGLISFKNLKNGFIAFEDTELKQTLITEEIIFKFKEQLVVLLAEILNPEIPFTEERKNP